jgi:hypothetical protein
MRRCLAWLIAVPLMIAGSEVAHVLAYRWAYPSAPVRVHELLASGHGYMAWAPLVLGVGGAIAGLSLVMAAWDAAAGRAVRPLPTWIFALLPAVAYTLQEHLERLPHTSLVWQTAREPTFLRGILLQLPFGLVAYVTARLLLRAAVRLGRSLARVAPPRPAFAAPALRGPGCEPDRRRVRFMACRQAERGPPLPASS